MAKFLPAIEALIGDLDNKKSLGKEGGYVNDKDDPGGETNYGITKRTFSDINIKTLTKKHAAKIYQEHWWDKYNYTKIDSQVIANRVLMLAVNMSNSPKMQAHIMVQRALNLIGEAVAVDGILGPITLKSVNSQEVAKLDRAIGGEASRHYYKIAKRRRTSRKFLYSWLDRTFDKL